MAAEVKRGGACYPLSIRVTLSSTSVARTLPFVCIACGHHDVATAHGLGQGTATILNVTPDEVSAQRALRDAELDAERTIQMAACPRCGVRDPKGVRRWWSIHLLPLLLVFAGIALAGWAPLLFDMNMHESDKWLSGWILSGIALLCCGGAAIGVLIKWSTTQGRVSFERGK